MTIKGSENMTAQKILGHNVDGREKGIYSTNTGEYWPSGKVCSKDLRVTPNAVYQCCKNKGTCKGRKLRKAEEVFTVMTDLADEVARRNEQQAELERKAALWDEYMAEQEAIRKAEEEAAANLANAEATYERRKRIYDRKMEEGRKAYARMMEAKNKRDALRAQQGK